MRPLLATLLLATAPAVARADDTPAGHCAVPGLNDVRVAGAGLYVGGEQDAAQLRKLKESLGVALVVDLRPEDAAGAVPEAKLAAAAGLRYQRIAIRGGDDLTLANAKRLDEALRGAKGAPVLVHCTSGNRAAALLALRDALVLGQPPEVALAFIGRSGLNKLEPVVRQRLAEAEPAKALHP